MGKLIQFPTGDSSYSARIAAAAAHERDTREAHLLALKGRNEVIREAVDNHHPQAAAARDAQLTPPSVTRILSMRDYDAEAA
ncbi:MAG: hypothetical protein HOY79_49675 [Streptomyces sp.]|nr:hypothetical protein [Streptomyces sp.]